LNLHLSTEKLLNLNLKMYHDGYNVYAIVQNSELDARFISQISQELLAVKLVELFKLICCDGQKYRYVNKN